MKEPITFNGLQFEYFDSEQFAVANEIMKEEELKMKKFDFGNTRPYYAYIDEDNKIVIGEERGRDGGILYTGPWEGSKTPYYFNILEENPNLLNDIVGYFNLKFSDVVSDALRSQTRNLLDEFEKHLPKALYDKVKCDCLEIQCTSQKIHILRTLDELKDIWEDGYDVVFVPAHFEKKKKGKK